MDWESIEAAPKDGTKVWVKRVYQRRIVAEGWAVWGLPHEHAPMRQSLGLDPLGRLSAADYRREAEERNAMVAEGRWLLPDRMYAFPTPTHWKPGATALKAQSPETAGE
jgi:hypothetical protein